MRPAKRFSMHVGALLAVIAVFAVGFASAQQMQGMPKLRLAQGVEPPRDIPEGAGDPDNGQAAQLLLRIDHLENQLRGAIGQIETLQNQQRRLEDQVHRLQAEAGAKASVAPPGPVAAVPTPDIVPPAPPKAAKKGDAFDPTVAAAVPGVPQPLGVTQPSAPLAKPAPAPPLDLHGAAAGGPTVIPGAGVGMLDGPRESLNAALDVYRQGNYDEAEKQLKTFVAANPAGKFTAEGIFYLGETYMQRSRPREAAEQYLRIYKDFSKSGRAPESMARLGQTLVVLGNGEQACSTFGEVGKRYPNAAPSVKKLVEREIQKNHC